MPEIAALRVPPGTRIDTPLCWLAQNFAALTGWRRYGSAFALGVVLAATLPPVDLTPLIFIAFPGLLWLDRSSAGAWASFRLGYVFGLGFFIAGLYWIAAALFVDIDRFWWLVPFAAAGLPALFALWSAAALMVTAIATRRLRLGPAGRACVFAIAWSASEWGRGHALTGFPWNLVGYAWSGGFPGAGAMLETTAWVGIYGLSLITMLAASLPAALGSPALISAPAPRRWGPGIAAAVLIAVPAAAGATRLALLPTVTTGIWLRLVQPSIPETLKWDPAQAANNLRRLIDLSRAPSDHKLAAVLWPEAAVPFFLNRDPAHRAAIAAIAPEGGYVITGTLRTDPPPAAPVHVWNSIEAIDGTGAIRAAYDKAHLVPFGEYVPLRGVLPLHKITGGSIDLSAGPGPRTVALPGLPAFGPLVCYEVIFPDTVVDRSDRPEWLFNATNDAWYGRSSGPYQHFAIARTRAVEEGLPLVRVANNGVSGVIDAEGRVLARINLDTIGYADVALPASGVPTLYSQVGDALFLVMLIAAAIPAAALARR